MTFLPPMPRNKSREETLLDKIDALRAEVERLRKDNLHWEHQNGLLEDRIERLREALQALHDWNVEYARINNLFNNDGTPATFHELLQARAVLEPKP